MRSAGDDGMSLVLCTTEGPKQVWLSTDGDIQENAPTEHEPAEMSDCLAITLSLVLIQSWLGALAHPSEFTPHRLVFVDQRRARAPAYTPLQPRAPPALV